MTLPGGADVLATPSIVADSVVIAAPATPGNAAKATATTPAHTTRPQNTVAPRCHPDG
jgi:hypothetical protein